jgi:hypothetical protein
LTETAVLDGVTFAPAVSLGFESDRQHIKVYAYPECAPRLATDKSGERSFRMTRLTRPL